MDLDSFTFAMDGKQEAQPVLELLVVSEGDQRAWAKTILHAKQTFLQRFGAEVKYAQRADAKRAKKATAKELTLLDTWLEDETFSPSPGFGIELCAGRSANELLPPSFEYMNDLTLQPSPIGALRVSLPASLSEAPQILRDMACALDGSQFSWASVGYSFYWDRESDNSRETREWMAPKLLRHPGFSWGRVPPYMVWSSNYAGLLNIGWLTLLGAALAERLGGAKALATPAAQAGLVCTALSGNGLMLQAGAEPCIGDVNRGDSCPLMSEVGRMVKPVFISDEDIVKSVYIDNMELETAQAWFGRFVPRD